MTRDATLPALTRPRPSLVMVFVAISLVGAGLMLWARHGGPPTLAMPFTVIASASYLLAAVLAGGLGDRYGLLMIAGLLFCMVGDVLGPRDFMVGLYAFLIAHFGIAGAFLTRGIDRRHLARTAPAALLVSAAVYLFWLAPHVPRGERLQVVGYTIVISLMVVAIGATPDFPGKRLAVAGAVLFYVSDVFVANWRYVDNRGWNAFVCYPLYYTACVLLAGSVVQVSLQERGEKHDST